MPQWHNENRVCRVLTRAPIQREFVFRVGVRLQFTTSAREGGTDTTEDVRQHPLKQAGPASRQHHTNAGPPTCPTAFRGVEDRSKACYHGGPAEEPSVLESGRS